MKGDNYDFNLLSMQILSCSYISNYRWDSAALLSLWNNNKVDDLLLQNGCNGLRAANVPAYILHKLCFDRYYNSTFAVAIN